MVLDKSTAIYSLFLTVKKLFFINLFIVQVYGATVSMSISLGPVF